MVLKVQHIPSHVLWLIGMEKRGEILSDIRKIYGPPEGEGIHPREASRHHVETSSAVLAEALRKAKISVDDLDIISYAAGPGLGPCLRVGAVVSRTLSSYYKNPNIPRKPCHWSH